jgi:hypothetical protein
MMKLLSIFLAVSVTACLPEPCVPDATRCDGSFVDVCGVGNYWEAGIDCSAVSGGDEAWMCCPVPADEFGPAGHACVPASECSVGGPI